MKYVFFQDNKEVGKGQAEMDEFSVNMPFALSLKLLYCVKQTNLSHGEE